MLHEVFTEKQKQHCIFEGASQVYKALSSKIAIQIKMDNMLSLFGGYAFVLGATIVAFVVQCTCGYLHDNLCRRDHCTSA
jgi:hypothetical protein